MSTKNCTTCRNYQTICCDRITPDELGYCRNYEQSTSNLCEVTMMQEFSGCQQGWQCPICKRIYSPITPMCYYCGNCDTVTTNKIIINPKVDYVHKDSITKTNDEG